MLVRLVLFCFLFAGVWSARVQADTLIVGLADADYPPFYYATDRGFEGAAVEIAEDLARATGHELTYKRYPWRRVQHNLNAGVVDMVILYFRTAEREQDVIYTDSPHLKERSSLFVPVHLDIQFNGELGSVSQYPFYGVRGYFYGDAYQQATFLDKFEVSNEPELIKKVANPRLNLVGIGNKPALEFYARKLGFEGQIRFLTPDLYEGDNYLAFSRTRKDARQLARAFSEQLSVYKKSKRYYQVLEKYGIRP